MTGLPLWSEQQVIEAIQAFHRREGRIPRLPEAGRRNGLPSGSVTRRLFGSWKAAIRAAGFEPMKPGSQPGRLYRRNKPRWTREECIAAIQRFHRQHGRTPLAREATADPELPSRNVLADRFGSYQGAIEAAGFPSEKAIGEKPKRREPLRFGGSWAFDDRKGEHAELKEKAPGRRTDALRSV